MPYIRISEELDKAIREKADQLEIAPDIALERGYFGCDGYEGIAREAKEILQKYTDSQTERYDMIKAWVKKATKKIYGQALVLEYDKIFKE